MRGSVPGYSLRQDQLVGSGDQNHASARLKAPETGWWFETTFIPIVMQPAAIKKEEKISQDVFLHDFDPHEGFLPTGTFRGLEF